MLLFAFNCAGGAVGCAVDAVSMRVDASVMRFLTKAGSQPLAQMRR